MKLFSLFNSNQELKTFSARAIGTFYDSYPPNSKLKLDDKKIKQKYKKAVQRLQSEVIDYKNNNNLGIYKKAKLISLIINGIEEHGYSEEIIEEIVEE